MKNIWKWILGIVIVLAILAIPVALHAMFNPYAGGAAWNFHSPRGPLMDGHGYDGYGWNNPRMPNDFRFGGEFGPGHRRGPFLPLFGGFFLFAGLLKIAFFGALLYGAYWLGRRNARITLDPAPASAPMEPESKPAPRPRKTAKS